MAAPDQTPTVETPPEPTPAPTTNAKALRESHGLTMVQVAAATGVSLNTLRRMERASDQATVDRMPFGFWRRLASVFGVSMGELMAVAPEDRS